MSQDSSGTLAFQTKMTWQMFLFTMTTIPPQKVCLGMSPAPSLIRDTWKTLDSHSSLHILQSLLPVKSVIIWMWNKPTFDDSNLHEWQVLVCLTWSHKSLFLYTEHSDRMIWQGQNVLLSKSQSANLQLLKWRLQELKKEWALLCMWTGTITQSRNKLHLQLQLQPYSQSFSLSAIKGHAWSNLLMWFCLLVICFFRISKLVVLQHSLTEKNVE